MKFFKNKEGFTLVELMVVVAIIGILSAVAIPNFKKYQSKSKTTEAKLQLAALYSTEVAVQTDYDVFATCLEFMGFQSPNGAWGTAAGGGSKNYYAVGFSSDFANGNNNVSDNGGDGCIAGSYGFSSGRKIAGVSLTTAHLSNSSTAFSAFTAEAVGAIDPDNATATSASRWTINENKVLNNTVKGY